MLTRKTKLSDLLLLVSFIVVFGACTGDNSTQEDRSVFKYNESAGIASLDPAFARDQANIWACNQLYNGLVQLDENLQVKPCIAKSWLISDSGRTYLFYLRNDVKFHRNDVFGEGKGRKVTANDFAYSFSRIADEDIASPGAWVLQNIKQGEDGMDALDDTTLQIRLSKPYPPFLGLLSMQYCSVVSKEVVEHFGTEFRSNPVGTGPFQLERWKEGSDLLLTKNLDYFEQSKGEQLPYLDAVWVTFIQDKQSAFLEFVKGNLDFVSGLDGSYKDDALTKDGQLKDKYVGKFKINYFPYLNTEYLGMLVDESAFKNSVNPLQIKQIRQAINYGFDRKKMVRYLRNNIGVPGNFGFVPPSLYQPDSRKVNGYSYDPTKAKKLLADAGYPGGVGLPDITLSTTGAYQDLCEYIQNQLADLGITLKLTVYPAASLREMIAQSGLAFFRGSWIADYSDPENYLSLFYSKNFCPSGPNYTHFANKSFDLLYEMALIEMNDTLRNELYLKMDELIMDESPVVVLYYDQAVRFYQNNITGLGGNPMNLLTLKTVVKE